MRTSTAPIHIDVWSDVACPWCYLGKHRLDLALRAYGETSGALSVEVEFRSYQLNPTLPADFEGGHSEYLAEHLGMSVSQIAASNRTLGELGRAVDIEYEMSAVVISNTFKAHALLHFAKAHGRLAEMKERLFRAYFTEGRRLGRIEELVDLATELRLDPDVARQALQASKYASAVQADMGQALRFGICGVPFFVLDGKYGLSGAQEPDTLLQAIETVAAERRGAA